MPIIYTLQTCPKTRLSFSPALDLFMLSRRVDSNPRRPKCAKDQSKSNQSRFEMSLEMKLLLLLFLLPRASAREERFAGANESLAVSQKAAKSAEEFSAEAAMKSRRRRGRDRIVLVVQPTGRQRQQGRTMISTPTRGGPSLPQSSRLLRKVP